MSRDYNLYINLTNREINMEHHTQSDIFNHLDQAGDFFTTGDINSAEREVGQAQSIFSEWFHAYDDDSYNMVTREITQFENKIERVRDLIKSIA